MQFEGALIKEQGVTFAIVSVKRHVLNSKTETENVMLGFKGIFGDVPIVLMTQDARGVPEYKGRPDIVNFLANLDPARIPWQRYTIA